MKFATLALCLLLCGVAAASAQIRIKAAPPLVAPVVPTPSLQLQAQHSPRVPVCTMQCSPGICPVGQVCPQNCQQVCN
jgi:hypothetical protein